jgi:hypothetical protein
MANDGSGIAPLLPSTSTQVSVLEAISTSTVRGYIRSIAKTTFPFSREVWHASKDHSMLEMRQGVSLEGIAGRPQSGLLVRECNHR